VRSPLLCSIGSIRPALITTKHRAWRPSRHDYVYTLLSCGRAKVLPNSSVAGGIWGGKCEDGDIFQRPTFPKIFRDFWRNIFATRALIDYDRAIGVTMPRLHGFHRFLPHLWELFYWAGLKPPSEPGRPRPQMAASAAVGAVTLDGDCWVEQTGSFCGFKRGRGRPGSLA
jgi:hypothetical protein